jgi:hypothetical protein
MPGPEGEYDLGEDTPETPDTGGPGAPPPPDGAGFPVAIAAAAVAIVALVVGGAYLVRRRPSAKTPATTQQPARALTPTPAPTSSPEETIALPPLDESDGLVRDLVKGLSSNPQVALWLAQDGLIRRFVAVVANVAEGVSPRPHLGFLAPSEPFRVVENAGRVTADPRDSARYDSFAAGVASLDAAGVARVIRLVTPLLDAAYRDLGHPEGNFRTVLARAVSQLLQTPSIPEGTPLRPVMKGNIRLYEYADPALEAFSAPQKALLRTGPRNQRAIQDKLREVAGALGLEVS